MLTVERLKELSEVGDMTNDRYLMTVGEVRSLAKTALAVKNGGWVKCSERLPEDGETVTIIRHRHGCICEVAVVTYIAPHFYDYTDIHIDFPATHWQPLPSLLEI